MRDFLLLRLICIVTRKIPEPLEENRNPWSHCTLKQYNYRPCVFSAHFINLRRIMNANIRLRLCAVLFWPSFFAQKQETDHLTRLLCSV